MKATLRFIGCAFAVMLVPGMAAGQAQPAMPPMQHDMTAMKGMATSAGWKEFDAFHALLMSITTPARSGDLKPAREKAAELVTAAAAWAGSKGPVKCDNTQARRWMPMVVRNAKAVAKVVDEHGTDANLKSALDLTHSEFEKVATPCLMPAAKDTSVDRFNLESMSGTSNAGRQPAPAVKKP
jgi:hypothetical protein